MLTYFQGKALHYKDEGSGRVLVLLHGYPESLSIWEEYTLTLSRFLRVIRIDLPGHGQSESLVEVHSMELMAEAVKCVLDAAAVRDCVMVGHSMGGYVTLAFAELYPKMLKGFGLFHSQAAADSEEARNNRDRTIELIRGNRTGFLNQFIPNLFAEPGRDRQQEAIEKLQKEADKVSAESLVSAMEGMKIRKDRRALLEKTKVPVLFILGKQDSRMPYNDILAQASVVGHAEILLLGKVAHMGFLEAPELTLRAVKDFAEKCFLY